MDWIDEYVSFHTILNTISPFVLLKTVASSLYKATFYEAMFFRLMHFSFFYIECFTFFMMLKLHFFDCYFIRLAKKIFM